jgi:hypothetical protein
MGGRFGGPGEREGGARVCFVCLFSAFVFVRLDNPKKLLKCEKPFSRLILHLLSIACSMTCLIGVRLMFQLLYPP